MRTTGTVLAVGLGVLIAVGCSKRADKAASGAAGAPADGKASGPVATSTAGPFTLEVTSIEAKESHEYGSGSSQATVSAQPGYQLVFVKLSIANGSDAQQAFTSPRLRLFGKGKEAIDADFIGFGDHIAQSGATISIEGKTSGPDGAEIVSYKGKLVPGSSFVEWALAPHKDYSDTLVFVVPSAAKVVSCELGEAGK